MDVSRKAPPKRGHFLLTVLAALVLTTLRSALTTLLSALTGLLCLLCDSGGGVKIRSKDLNR
jgi:hypothetical protein